MGTELKDLAGKHILDAVDMTVEQFEEYDGEFRDANVCIFRLNGTAYAAVEDESDGYRSSMRSLVVRPKARMKNRFPAITVVGIHRNKNEYHQDDILELVDVESGKTVLTVGTRNSDDYYPSFVASFQPENMSTNARTARAEGGAE